MRKALLWILGVMLAPIAVIAALAVLLYLPPVQRWAVDKVSEVVSESTGMTVTVNRVRLSFPLNLYVGGFRATQVNDSLPQLRDTIADVGGVVADVQLCPLLHKKIVVNALDLNKAKINTADFVASARVKGYVERLYMTSRGIDLDSATVQVTDAVITGAAIDVALSDTVPPDTTKTKTPWKIYINKVAIANTNTTVHMPGDTLQISVGIGRATATDGVIDLTQELYTVSNFTLANGTVRYDNRWEPLAHGLDVNHIALSDVNVSIDSIFYKAPDLKLNIAYCRLKEKSGLQLTNLSGAVAMDSLRLKLPTLVAVTPDSHIEAEVDMDFNTFNANSPGRTYLRLMASLGKQDIMRFCGSMPRQFVQRWPNHPLTVRGSVNGNMRGVEFTGLYVQLPTAFRLKASGEARNITDIDHLQVNVALQGITYDLGFVTCLLDPAIMKNYRIPSGIGIDGRLKANGRSYAADANITEGRGRIAVKGSVDMRSEAYKAALDINNIDVRHFMPRDSIRTVSATMTATGHGFDVLSKRSTATVNGNVKTLRYGHTLINDMKLQAQLGNGKANATVEGHDALIDGTVTISALLDKKRIDATLATDLRKADLYALHLTNLPIAVGGCAHIDVTSDMKQSHSVNGTVDDMTVFTAKRNYRPTDLTVDILTNPDTTWANVASGNFDLHLKARGGYERIANEGQSLWKELQRHLANKTINQQEIAKRLPLLSLKLKSGGENPFANFLRMKGVTFSDIDVALATSPRSGINGNGHIFSLVVDSTRVDTIVFNISQTDTTNIHFTGRVENNKRNPQYVFRALVDGELLNRGAGLNVKYYDADNRLGLSLGAKAEALDSGINVHFAPYRPLIGYKEFNLNKDNYIFLGRDKRISAKLDVVADDGTGVKLSSNDDNRDMLQDLTVSLNKFDLAKITSVIPYAPSMEGLLDGDFRVMMNREEKISMLSDLSVGGMSYEHCPLGNVSGEFVYLQRDSASHYVDARISRDDREVGTLKGTYKSRNGGEIDAKVNLARTPMSMVNGFIPDQLFGLIGYAEGEVDVKGKVSSPQVDGEVYLDSAFLISVPYGMHLRMDNDPVRVVGSNLLLENFSLYANNDNPLVIAGNIDFSNLDKIKLAMRMRAEDYLLIDSKKTSKSIAYGKAYVNVMGMLNGYLDNLRMRGKLDVLGKTDVNYILKDSPLNTDDQLKDLVTFTDFRDTTAQVTIARPDIQGLDMQMMVNVESGARVFCALNADQSNYVDVEGGGELRMTYNPTDELQLFGRYAISSGEMKYSLPIIPLKTFNIKSGSYIEFAGDVMNPKLNIEATEDVKAAVANEGGSNRTVLFNCGVRVTQTLNNMGLEFTLDAPEDMTVKNELAAMSAEMRGRLAVTMLTTGMYLSDGNTSAFSMNNALNTFLQSEISNITNNASRTLDISVGMDQNSDATGNTYTDYSFKFAKRFWNNRFNFVIGGKISDASSAASTDNSFIDNVSLEYRLDQSAERYVRLFYDKTAQDLLEDRISRYGAGFVWRRKLDKLKHIFSSGNKNANMPRANTAAGRDSTLNHNENK